MPLTPEQAERIAKAVGERLNNDMPCPLCGVDDWALLTEVVPLVVQSRMSSVPSGSLLNAPLVCNNCGNTHLLNLIALGLGDLANELSEP